MAIVKIALHDVSNREALYRVGAFFALASIALAVAYAYSRRAQAPFGEPNSRPGVLPPRSEPC
jgi:hypothetical protein